MDFNEKPQAKARSNPNIISRIFICWVCPVLYRGNKRDVVEEDLIVPNKRYDSDRLGEKFEKYWLDEVNLSLEKNREPSLWKAMWKAFWWDFLPGAIYIVIMTAARIMQPMLFTRLLGYWSSDSTVARSEAGLYALGMLGLLSVAIMCNHHNALFVNRFSLKVKIACSSILYRKLLRMSQVSMGDVAAGKLVNLLSNDIARFDYAFMFMHYLWVIPIQAAIVLYFLYDTAGYAPFVGFFGVVILIMPVQSMLTKFTSIVRRKTAKRTDTRIKLMSEIINGIQVIKMYAWEKPFEAVVSAARAFEMTALRKALFIRSVFLGFMLFTERSTLFLTALTLVLSGSMVTATTIYPIQQYLSLIQMNLTLILPIAIAGISEMRVSLERIQSFLVLEEREDISVMPTINGALNQIDMKAKPDVDRSQSYIVPQKYSPSNTGLAAELVVTPPRASIKSEFVIELANVSASWTKSEIAAEMTLKNISMRLRKGKLCAVIGPVGSGKSSLLQVLLRELPTTSGSFVINGKVSYASQESWLFPATVRQNILFGLPYEQKRYNEVCKACCLMPDFKQFPYGDMSLVGERGVSLSGGQRARINLARAVYREADIYLLDDPLSAVDANVGRQLFEGCINGYLRSKTCILVTHQIHFLKGADHIVVLNDGAIENMGSYDELAKSGKEFSLLLSNLQEDVGDEETAIKRPSMKRGVSRVSVKSDNTTEHKEQIQEAEERAKGNLNWAVVMEYLASVNSWFLVFLAGLALVITQVAATGVDFFLSFWTNQVDQYIQNLPEGEEPDPSLGTEIGMFTNGQYLLIQGSLVVLVIVFAQLRITGFVVATMRASQNIHDNVFKKLVVSTMRFFDTNPSGRVLNRFSKDLGSMDEFLPRSLLETIQMYFSMTSILVLNAIALPWTLIPTLVLVLIFVMMLKWYLNAAQAVKRLEGTTKSPVFGMINSTISGLSTIRSSGSQDRLLRTFDSAQDLHSSAFYTFVGGTSAFGLYLDTLCLVYLAAIISIFLLIDFGDVIPVGSIGLAVSQSMVLTFLLQMAARFTADFLAQMTSVERVLEYTKLPTEENMNDGPTKPPPNWPSEGNLKFENVFLYYSPEDPPVLKNLNIQIQSGWKVGIVGRTGAGKSSLISALYRLSTIEGSIQIDGIDTKGVAKKDMRQKISIIPQEPVLFSATVRYNLDPFDLYTDDELWRALEQVELKDSVQALDFYVTEGGGNFSVGQRQLMCLARAILRSNKILVMDEATANVDPQTDALIQKTIRKAFTTCTVLTIAHRLNTVMDSDRVLVMDKGEAIEFDYPYILLSNPDSIFTSMVKETGENMKKVLFEVAKTKYFSDHPQQILRGRTDGTS